MASNSTTSNYANQINPAFPVPGQDNSSQGFRDNFANIQNAILSADGDIQNLYSNLILTTTTSSNFHNNIILQAVFQSCADQVYPGTDTQGTINIDVTQGGYQDYQLNGDANFTVSGFSSAGYSSVIVGLVPTAGAPSVNFAAGISRIGIGTTFPEIIADTTFYQLWSSDGGTNVYITKIGNDNRVTAVMTATTLQAGNELIIGSNSYTTGTNYITTVAANGMYGTLAVLPNRIPASFTTGTINEPANTSQFQLVDNEGIHVGATTTLPTTSTVFTVSTVSGATLIVTPAAQSSDFVNFPILLTFTNPPFTGQNLIQPTVVTLVSSAPASRLGEPTDLSGQLYVNSTTLYVSHNTYDGVNSNWIEISDNNVPRQLPAGTSATTVDISNSSTVIATTEFSQNLVKAAVYGGIEGALPPGVITLWYGSIASIPQGWALCDGSVVNGYQTPNLTNTFVIGASQDTAGVPVTTVTGSTSTIGGSVETTLPEHLHLAGSVVSDPGHHHTYNTKTGVAPQSGSSTQCWVGDATANTGDAQTGITVTTSVLSTGTDASIANLPPYYALAYIMKIV